MKAELTSLVNRIGYSVTIKKLSSTTEKVITAVYKQESPRMGINGEVSESQASYLVLKSALDTFVPKTMDKILDTVRDVNLNILKIVPLIENGKIIAYLLRVSG